MKKLLIATTAAVVMLVSCEEKAPLINLTDNTKTDTTSKDSIYVAPVETPQQHMVLVEEFTGASCANCPAAHELLKSLYTQNPGRIISMAMHINNFPQSNPRPESKYDFRTAIATTIGADIFGGIGAMPTAGIDRAAYNSSILLDTRRWSSLITSQLATVSPVNISVTSSYDATSSVATIKVKLAYTQEVTATQNISIAILQDSLIDHQEYPDHDDDAYPFNGIFRDMATPMYGDPVLVDTARSAGLVFIRTYKYTVKPDVVWEPKNARVVAFVNSAQADAVKKIYEAAYCKLIGE